MTALNTSAPPQTVAITAAQSLLIPQWLAVSMARNLRAASIRGGLNQPMPPTLCPLQAQTYSYFR